MATTKKGMNDYTINSDGSNEQSIDVEGDFIHIQAVSVAGAAVQIRIDDGKTMTRFQGQGNRAYYSRVTVLGSVACTIVLQLGYGYATDARSTIAVGSITAPIQPALHNIPLAAVVVGAGAQALLAAADASRLELGVSVDSTQPNGVFIGDNTVANEVGVFLEPGQVQFLSTAAAVYAWNNGAAGVRVRLINMRSI
jgi:hypothetical protein